LALNCCSSACLKRDSVRHHRAANASKPRQIGHPALDVEKNPSRCCSPLLPMSTSLRSAWYDFLQRFSPAPRLRGSHWLAPRAPSIERSQLWWPGQAAGELSEFDHCSFANPVASCSSRGSDKASYRFELPS
jgi:hypothetical protein